MSNFLQKAVDILGGISATARALGVTPQAVRFWLAGDRKLPAERALDLERLTAGRVRVEQLRPDVDWSVVRDRAKRSRTAPRVAAQAR